MNYTKTGKGRYQVSHGDLILNVFKDSYTGLWRIKQEGGPVDWAGPFKTLKEAKARISQFCGD